MLDRAVRSVRGRAGPVRCPAARVARLHYAYAEALLDAGQEAEARQLVRRARPTSTPDGGTDAEQRVDELDGLTHRLRRRPTDA